jgi:hypothetical protein
MVHTDLMPMSIQQKRSLVKIVALALFGLISTLLLEYSIEKDAAFCMMCYLFGKGTGIFVKGGWKNWNIGVDALGKYMENVRSAHKKAQGKYNLFVQGKPIDNVIVKVSQDSLCIYKTKLPYSLRCLRFLLHQGLTCRGHDESEESKNKGNFLKLLNWLTGNNEFVDKVVPKNAPGNCTLTSPKIQKQIIGCCSEETVTEPPQK